MKGQKAIIFDVDGTLLDTREFILQAYEHALSTHGHVVPSRNLLTERMSLGIPLEAAYTIFAPDGDIIALRDSHREFQKDRLELIVAYEGLIDLLSELKEKRFLLGACSSRGPSVRPSLEHASALSYFDTVIDSTEVTHHKPHPEGIEKILSRLSVEPIQAVMIGDTPADIGAGINAGVAQTIGVTHGFGTREALQDAGATYIVDSLAEVLPLLG